MGEFWAVRVRLREDLSELLFPLFSSAGTRGLAFSGSEDALELLAYFDAPQDAAWWASQMNAAMQRAGFSADRIAEICVEPVPIEDWASRWKEGYKPFPVGRRFLIAPSWDQPRETGDRCLIVIDPGMAFGTGTHETTQHCLLALEEYWTGRSLLDVGTGTGILAIAAARLHPQARIVALDIDPEACAVARENLERNGVRERVVLHCGTLEELPQERFEMVLANLTADVLVSLLPLFSHRLEPGGILVLSGLLEGDEEPFREALLVRAFRSLDVKRGGEWRTIVARYEPPSVLCTSGSD
ncbi:MAG: 50S ribosomal protein L11 methyltransferase [Blastocatellia bacterium]|nr:50S ribosomal protein L11 methyltransferase [Blastocatellia bacterium]MCX7753158.1 50S ribosomal protein L11 methyltransferase [Blastocatellia bacterium]MDW8169473.1 50S ribosomal protein L11 methyltransferase [Acidobacteriota bacterium]